MCMFSWCPCLEVCVCVCSVTICRYVINRCVRASVWGVGVVYVCVSIHMWIYMSRHICFAVRACESWCVFISLCAFIFSAFAVSMKLKMVHEKCQPYPTWCTQAFPILFQSPLVYSRPMFWVVKLLAGRLCVSARANGSQPAFVGSAFFCSLGLFPIFPV